MIVPIEFLEFDEFLEDNFTIIVHVALLERFSSIADLCNCSLLDLFKLPGIGRIKAFRIKHLLESKGYQFINFWVGDFNRPVEYYKKLELKILSKNNI